MTAVVAVPPDCFCRKTVAEVGERSVAWQFQPLVACGRLIVQAEVGAAPTSTVKAPLPLLLAIVASVPPQPDAAIVGATTFSREKIWPPVYIATRRWLGVSEIARVNGEPPETMLSSTI